MRTETWAFDVYLQAGRSSCLQFACGSVWQQVLSGTQLEDICQNRKSEIFCLSFLGHSKFSLMFVEGTHQTEKSMQLINCCVRVIGSLATLLLSCLQGLGLNAKDLTRLSWLSSGKEQLQRELEGGFHPSVRAPGDSCLHPLPINTQCLVSSSGKSFLCFSHLRSTPDSSQDKAGIPRSA